MIGDGRNRLGMPSPRLQGFSTLWNETSTCVPRTSIKERLYLTLVRPHLEYGVAAWNPHQLGHQSVIERVQHRAIRFVHKDYGRTSSVFSMLSIQGWERQVDRRESHQVTQLYKIINQDIDVDASDHLHLKTKRSRGGTASNLSSHISHLLSTWTLFSHVP